MQPTQDHFPDGLSRRNALTAGAGAAGVAIAGAMLAACSSSKTNGPNNPSTPATTPESTTGSTAGSSASAGGTPIAKLADITVGGAVSAKLADGSKVIVSRPTSTSAVCFSAICTHEGCTVAPEGTKLHCPCHGSEYNITTGAVTKGPAPDPLPKVNVTVENGEVLAAAG